MNTATAIAQSEARSLLAYARHRMFDGLRRFVRVYARSEEEQRALPELDIVWATGIDGGPETVIQEAIKSCPAMWFEALPPECCIVPRDMLRKFVSDAQAEILETYGTALVSDAAARIRYEVEQR